MLRIGFLLVGIGIVWYIVHAVIYNYFLRKHDPDFLNDSFQPPRSSKKNKKVTVVVSSGRTPAWIILFGMPSIPLFLLGIVITVVALIINIFQPM